MYEIGTLVIVYSLPLPHSGIFHIPSRVGETLKANIIIGLLIKKKPYPLSPLALQNHHRANKQFCLFVSLSFSLFLFCCFCVCV